MSNSETDRLAAGKYLLLTTFRRDGTPVPTPVWVVRDGERLLAWSARTAGKVKRLRHTSRVELAPCDLRGTPTGPSAEGTAQLLDQAGTDRARRLIVRRFPLTGRLVAWGSLLRRGREGTVGISVTPSTKG